MREKLIGLTRSPGWTGIASGSLATLALCMAVVAQAQAGPSVAPSVTLNLGHLRTDRSSTVANDLARSAGATRLVDEFGHPTLIIRGDPAKLEAALRDLLARNRIKPVEVENLATPTPTPTPTLQDLAAGRGLRRPELEQTVGPALQVQILTGIKEARYASCSTPECRRLVDGQLAGLAPALAGLGTQPPACDAASAAYSQAALARSTAGRVRVKRLAEALKARAAPTATAVETAITTRLTAPAWSAADTTLVQAATAVATAQQAYDAAMAGTDAATQAAALATLRNSQAAANAAAAGAGRPLPYPGLLGTVAIP